MAQKTMYSAVNNSIQATLTASIAATDTIIPLSSVSYLPAAPNLVTIGTDDDAEVIRYNGIDGLTLTGCERGFDGTTAKVWLVNEVVYRAYTHYDHETFKSNIEDLDTDKLAKTGDGSSTTVSFTAATQRTALATNSKLSVLFGLLSKWLTDLKGLAFKDKVTSSDFEDNAVSNSALAQMAAKTIKGNATDEAAPPTDLSASDVRSLLNVSDGADGKDATINGVNALTITAGSGIEATQSGSVLTLSGQDALDYAKDLVSDPTLDDPGGYIGMHVEGGGIIFFDYAIGFKGDVSVAPITSGLNTYHVDPATGIVVKDTTDGTNRFYIVQDRDLVMTKDGDQLMWSNGTSGTLYTSLGTATGWGTGLANTELAYAAANTDGLLEWNSDAYKCIWHYIWKGDYQYRSPKWFVPSKDELNVLLNMQWETASKRKSYDGTVQLKQLPVNLPPYLWSSSEQSATVAYYANLYSGYMNAGNKNNANSNRVRLVRTF